ncbi:MAG: hypothetical protein SV375_23820, partial [Thermodesulfobacteriota bacterium]|nr:hypothetical protein [Thermodesulfobacteriota bacterium]
LPLLIGWKVVDFMEDTEGEEEKFYFVEEAKKMELEYYKNSIIHFFIPHCLVAISLLSGAEEVKQIESIISDYIFLKNLFKNEFVFDAKENPREKIMSIADYFLDSAYLTRAEENEGYKVTKLGFDKLPIWAALSKTFLESYWIAVKSIGRKKIKGLKNEDLLKNMNYLGKRFHKLGVIDHIEALSYLNFNNALNTINEEIMDITDDTEDHSPAIDRLSQLGQRLYELSHYRS